MKIADNLLTRTKALPAAGAAAVTDSIDLKAEEVGPIGANLEVHVEIPALASLSDDKDAVVSFEDSADDSTFAAVTEMGSLTVTGAGGAGSSAATERFYLPPSVKRYLRATTSVEASGGDNTGDSITVKVRV